MSTTTALGVVPDRRPFDLAEFRNSHGWAPSIWRRLLIHNGYSEHWMSDDTGLHWLWKNIEALPEWQQAPLVLTFDTSVSENPFDPWDGEADEPGGGIPLAEMYLLPQHRTLVCRDCRASR
jgi:hypothetical protein